MKQNITKNIISLSLLLAIFTSHIGLAFAQTPTEDAFNSGGLSLNTLPSEAIVGSTAERRDAWNSLSETEKAEASARLKEIVESSQPTQQDSEPVSLNLSFVSNLDAGSVVNASATKELSSGFFQPMFGMYATCPSCPPPPPIIVDSDADGVSDDFENNLADGFTPFYHVSGGEDAGTGFARFNDSVPQTVSQVFGPTPPISHFRVKPLGFATRNDGVRYGLIQLDYLTLWNKDDGLVTSGLCLNNPFINPLELGGHNIDNERSALLVAAPASGSTYNPNLQDYKIYEVYTSAHEGTFFDHSIYINLSTPVSFNSHIYLALSRSKHATYPFNPNNFRLVPQYVIFSTYATISYLFASGQINYLLYLALLAAADQTFTRCIVEQFQNQGGVYANTRINVGELNQPLNGSSFIRDTELSNKLSRLFY